MKLKNITIKAPVKLSVLIDHFKTAITESDYKDMVSILVNDQKHFTVIIQKMGTSKLVFDTVSDADGACEVELGKTDIAFLHKSFMDSVVNWIRLTVEDIGGTLVTG
jgi:hypothetical protein